MLVAPADYSAVITAQCQHAWQKVANLGDGMHGNVSAKIEGPLHKGSNEGCIHNDCGARGLACCNDSWHVRHLHEGVAHALQPADESAQHQPTQVDMGQDDKDKEGCGGSCMGLLML